MPPGQGQVGRAQDQRHVISQSQQPVPREGRGLQPPPAPCREAPLPVVQGHLPRPLPPGRLGPRKPRGLVAEHGHVRPALDAVHVLLVRAPRRPLPPREVGPPVPGSHPGDVARVHLVHRPSPDPSRRPRPLLRRHLRDGHVPLRGRRAGPSLFPAGDLAPPRSVPEVLPLELRPAPPQSGAGGAGEDDAVLLLLPFLRIASAGGDPAPPLAPGQDVFASGRVHRSRGGARGRGRERLCRSPAAEELPPELLGGGEVGGGGGRGSLGSRRGGGFGGGGLEALRLVASSSSSSSSSVGLPALAFSRADACQHGWEELCL